MDINNKKFLVTGGAGFIGSHIVEYLLKMGAEKVRVLDNLSTGFLKNIEHLMNYKNFEFIKGDITNWNTCLEVMDGIDIVCHQAAMGSVPKSVLYPSTYHDCNVTGFINILCSAKEKGIKRIVYASSSSVYGDDENLVKVEGIEGSALSPYGLTKYLDELYGDLFTRLYGLECIGLRYFNVFGPRQNPNGEYAAVIPKFVTLLKEKIQPTIYGDGLQSRDFTFVANVVNANLMAMMVDDARCYGQAFNIGTGESVTVLDLYGVIKGIMGVDVEPKFAPKRDGDVKHSKANVDKSKELLGWAPTVKIIEGLGITVESFL